MYLSVFVIQLHVVVRPGAWGVRIVLQNDISNCITKNYKEL